jgi:hypothetical protein
MVMGLPVSNSSDIHYIDRWIFSMIVGTCTLLILMVIWGIGHIWDAMIPMWLMMIALNNLRLMAEDKLRN